jgi:hypothetical protein
MKKILYLSVVITFIFSGCAVDPDKARAVAENYLADQKSEQYDNLNDYFTPSFNESEPRESKIDKLKQIKDALGAIESFALAETQVSERGLDDPSTVQLTYTVKYTRGTAKQIFIIMNEEGEHKITFMNVVSEIAPAQKEVN